MPLKKLQEKSKKNRDNKITLYSTKSIRTSLNNNKKQINSHHKKESCPFLYDYNAPVNQSLHFVKFWNNSGFVWPFYTLIEFLDI